MIKRVKVGWVPGVRLVGGGGETPGPAWELVGSWGSRLVSCQLTVAG